MSRKPQKAEPKKSNELAPPPPAPAVKMDPLPPFLKRGTKEHAALVKRAEKLAAEGKGMMLVTAEDRDVPIHALAAELGFKKHQYRVEWFRDEAWLKARMEEKAKRDEEEAVRKAKRDAEKAKQKAERELLGTGNRVSKKGDGKPRARADVPQGRILWVGPNPKKEGTDAWQRWEKLRAYDKKSVESYLFDKCNPTTLVNAVKAGKVKVLSDSEIDSLPASAPAQAGAGAKKPKGKKAGGAAEPDGGNAGAARAKPAKPAVKRAVAKPRKAGRVSGRGLKKKGGKR